MKKKIKNKIWLSFCFQLHLANLQPVTAFIRTAGAPSGGKWQDSLFTTSHNPYSYEDFKYFVEVALYDINN